MGKMNLTVSQLVFGFILSACAICCKPQAKLIYPDKLNFDGEEKQLLLKDVSIQYLPSEQFGVASSNRKLNLVAVRVDNQSSEEILLRQPLLSISDGEATDLSITNPPIKLTWEKTSGRDRVLYVLKDFNVIYRQEEIESKALRPALAPITNTEQESLILGAAHMAFGKRALKKYKKPFFSSIFQKAIPPKTSVYGFLPIQGKAKTSLRFSYREVEAAK